jgi:hypothetical protein
MKTEPLCRLPLYRFTRNAVRGYVFERMAYYNRKRRHAADERFLPPLMKRDACLRRRQAA